MKIKMIEGTHLTALEKKAIKALLENNLTEGCTSKVKCFKILSKNKNRYRVRIGSKATWNIGQEPKWRYSDYLIEISK